MKNAAYTALNVKDIKAMMQLQVDIKSQVEVAKNDPARAQKIFGIDKMSTEQKKSELHKTTLVRFKLSFRSLYLDQMLKHT